MEQNFESNITQKTYDSKIKPDLKTSSSQKKTIPAQENKSNEQKAAIELKNKQEKIIKKTNNPNETSKVTDKKAQELNKK